MRVEQTRLANKVITLLCGAPHFTKTWIDYLIHSRFDCEMALRNKVFCIYIVGLIDVVRGHETKIRDIETAAQKLNMKACIDYTDLYTIVFEATADLLGVLSEEDYMFLYSTRDQWVHGQLSAFHQEKWRYYFLSSGNVKKGTRPIEAIHDVDQKYLAKYGSVDGALARIRSDIYNHRTFFWHYMFAMGLPKFQEILAQDLLSATYQRPRAVVITGTGIRKYADCTRLHPDKLDSLIEFREKGGGKLVGEIEQDSVFPCTK